MDQKLLKGGEVASLLNISRTQAFTLMQRGDIATVRFGKLVRVRMEDLEMFIEANRNSISLSNPKPKPAVDAAG